MESNGLNKENSVKTMQESSPEGQGLENRSNDKEQNTSVNDLVSSEDNSKEQKMQHQTSTYFKDEALEGDTRLIGQDYIKEEMDRPPGFAFYFFLPLMMLLPVVNLVLAFSWTFGKYVNTNKRKIGVAFLLWTVVIIAVAILFGDAIFLYFSDVLESLVG